MRANNKQKRFVDEYLIDLNATAAASRAGYKNGEFGRQLLTYPYVADLIQKRIKARQTRTEITQDRVLLEIARLAFSDGRKAFDKDGRLLPVHEWSDDVAASISSIKVRTKYKRDSDGNVEPETVTEIKMWDKNSALEKAGKHLGLFMDRMKVEGELNVSVDLSPHIKEMIESVRSKSQSA